MNKVKYRNFHPGDAQTMTALQHQAEALAFLRDQGHAQAWLEVYAHNQAALNLYHQFGFESFKEEISLGYLLK